MRSFSPACMVVCLVCLCVALWWTGDPSRVCPVSPTSPATLSWISQVWKIDGWKLGKLLWAIQESSL